MITDDTVLAAPSIQHYTIQYTEIGEVLENELTCV